MLCCAQRPKKIVGLVRVRNESAVIEQCLKALSIYTDAIIVLDDASEDNTVKIVESLSEQCHVQKIIKKSTWHFDEAGDKNALLKAGREIGGTHFIVIDADEMLTANCAHNNFFKNNLYRLNPGDRLALYMFHLWKGIKQYRFYDPPQKEIVL